MHDTRRLTLHDDVPDELLLHILCFLCHDGELSQQLQLLQWSGEALRIALTCKRLYNLIFVDSANDRVFWRGHCIVFMRSIQVAEQWRSDQMDHSFTGPRNVRDNADMSKCEINERVKMWLPPELAVVEENQQRENYYRLLTSRHHQLHKEYWQQLQRLENERTKRFFRSRYFDLHLLYPLQILLCTLQYVNSLLFFGLQTLQGFLHWLLVDVLQFDWYAMPSYIQLHVSSHGPLWGCLLSLLYSSSDISFLSIT